MLRHVEQKNTTTWREKITRKLKPNQNPNPFEFYNSSASFGKKEGTEMVSWVKQFLFPTVSSIEKLAVYVCTHTHKGPPILYTIFRQNAFLAPQLSFCAKDVWLNQFKQQHGIWQQSISAEIKPAATKSIDPFSYWFVNSIKRKFSNVNKCTMLRRQDFDKFCCQTKLVTLS